MPLLRRRPDPGNQLAPGYLDPVKQDELRGCANMGEERVKDYRLYEDYYDGQQRTQLLDRAKVYLQASGIRFCENICETVVDVLAERLKVVAFKVTDNEPASDWLTGVVWPRNRMDETQGVVHTETIKLGDGFVIVDWNEQRQMPRFRWNRPHTIKPEYDDLGDMQHASKVWSTDEVSPINLDGRLIMRLNIYRPDRVEKWFSWSAGDDATWQPFMDPGDKSWPLPWTETGRLPADLATVAEDALGIPVFHFRNKPKGRRLGRSEVRGPIPYQDELNKQIIDLFYVMDAQGWKQRWATGIEDPGALAAAIGEWVSSPKESAKFGEFAAEDPQPMLAAIDATLRRLSMKTRTPMFDLIEGTPPSGEALKTAESGLTRKCGDRATTLGNSWEDVARMGWRLSSVFGKDPAVPVFDPDADINAVWDSFETRDETAEAARYESYQRLGLSKATILRELGYDPDEEATQRADEAQASAEAQQKAFDRMGAFGGGQ